MWRRRHVWHWPAQRAIYDTRELIALVRDVDPASVRPTAHDSLFAGAGAVEEHRWWSADEIAASADEFAPRRLAEHLRRLLDEGPPPAPVDVGV